MVKKKNMKEFLRSSRRVPKVVEDGMARERIISTIGEWSKCRIDFTRVECVDGSDVDVLSSDLVSDVDDLVSDDVVDKATEDKDITTNDNIIPTKDEIITKDDIITTTTTITTSLEDRVNRVKQFTNLNLPIDYSRVESYLVLPKKYLRLSRIFKALLTVQKYNTTRKLTSIFEKVRGSIERTLRTRVEEEDIKRLYYLLPEYLDLKSITLEEKRTFTFKINCTSDVLEKRLMEYHKCVVKDRRLENRRLKEEDVEDIPLKEYNVEDVKNEVKGDKVNVNENTTTTQHSTSPTQPTTPHSIKFVSVLERVRERERKRKEEFIGKMKEKNKERDILKKVEVLFKKEGKKALRLREIVDILEIYNGMNLLKSIIDEQTPRTFELKKISGEDHLVYVKSQNEKIN